MKSAFLLLVIFCTVLIQPYLSLQVQSGLYALSLTIKEVILFTIPFLIFCFLLNAILELKLKAIGLILLLFALIVTSSVIASTLAYGLSTIFIENKHTFKVILNSEIALPPLWTIHFPHFITNNTALIMSAVVSIIFLNFMPTKGKIIGQTLMQLAMFFLKKILLPIIPLFIVGFMIKMGHEKMFLPILKTYSYIFLLIAVSASSYIFLWYAFLVKSRMPTVLKNMLPPAITGFSTMSSNIAMPFLIIAAEKNIGKSSITTAIIPPLSNFHLVCECFTIPMLALSIISVFGGNFPDLPTYLHFVFYFIIAKFAMVGIPGSGAFIMVPVLRSHLGFNDEMAAFLTTLYILFDCINTALNIIGNGAFIIAFKKIYTYLFKSKSEELLHP